MKKIKDQFIGLFLIILLGCLLLGACSKGGNPILPEQKPSATELPTQISVITPPSWNQPFNLQMKSGTDSFAFNGVGYTLTDINDSRCPVDVTCVYPGKVQITLRSFENGQKSQSYILTLGSLSEGESNSVELKNGYLVLSAVTPEMKKDSNPQKSDYIITLYLSENPLQ